MGTRALRAHYKNASCTLSRPQTNHSDYRDYIIIIIVCPDYIKSRIVWNNTWHVTYK